MARKTRESGAATDLGPRHGVLGEARAALSQGNVRLARERARAAAASGTEEERRAAADLLARTAPDPRALLTVGAVLLLILIAAIFGIFHR